MPKASGSADSAPQGTAVIIQLTLRHLNVGELVNVQRLVKPTVYKFLRLAERKLSCDDEA